MWFSGHSPRYPCHQSVGEAPCLADREAAESVFFYIALSLGDFRRKEVKNIHDEGATIPPDYSLIAPLGLPTNSKVPDPASDTSTPEEYDLYFRIVRDHPDLLAWTRTCLGHWEHRLKLAQQFGATDVITARDEQAVQEVLEKTRGGADAVLECVGTLASLNTALHITRPGKSVGSIGFPHISEVPDLSYRFFQNITVNGGLAPVRTYLPELLQDVIAGTIDPSAVLDMTVDLDGVPSGYAAMDTREAIKVMVCP